MSKNAEPFVIGSKVGYMEKTIEKGKESRFLMDILDESRLDLVEPGFLRSGFSQKNHFSPLLKY